MTRSPSPKAVAKSLWQFFMSKGRYTFSAGPIGAETGMQLAATPQRGAIWGEAAKFEGIAVQAVGCADSGDQNGVYVYASKGSARAFRALPTEISGIPIAVKKIGTVDIRPDLAAGSSGEPQLYQLDGRIACGSSCAPAGESYAGTLGALVRRGDEMFALSNNHVFAACNHTQVSMPIMAPAHVDSRPNLPAPLEVARHAEIVPLVSGDPFLVTPCREDVAIARIEHADRVSSWQGADWGYDTPCAVAEPTSGMRVKKIGRTTGLTTGTVEARIDEATPIPCQTRFFKGTVYFEQMWYVLGDSSGFALPGDSGSLVVSEEGDVAVGLLFSCNKSGDYGLIVPISRVLGQFGGLSLVAGHGV